MSYRRYNAPEPLLIGYDPVRDLPKDHLAWLVEEVVEELIAPPDRRGRDGQPPYDPRLVVKVLIYGYATGVRSTRRLEEHCGSDLPYLLLTRGDTPSYHTLSTGRNLYTAELELVWAGLVTVAARVGMRQVGNLTIDSSRIPANCSRESVVKQEEYAAVLAELRRILAEARLLDAAEDAGARRAKVRLEQAIPVQQMREVLRGLRKTLRQRRREEAAEAGSASTGATTAPVAEPPAPVATADAEHADEDEGGGTSAKVSTGVLPLDGVPPGRPAVEEPVGVHPNYSERMLRRIQQAVETIEAALGSSRQHVSLTDPDAQFMPCGTEKQLAQGHAFEAAVDQGLLVVAQRGPDPMDNGRLEPILKEAQQQERCRITRVDADSGYYHGDAVGKLEQAGIDTCIPDSNTAGDLHRGRTIGSTRGRAGTWALLEWDAEARVFRCVNGNVLRKTQVRQGKGQTRTIYRAEKDCTGCSWASECLRRADAKRRTIAIGKYHEELEAARQRFNEPEHVARYRHRGEAIETVFAFLRENLGYDGWLLRGDEGVKTEARLFGLAYQLRKIHRAWATARAVNLCSPRISGGTLQTG